LIVVAAIFVGLGAIAWIVPIGYYLYADECLDEPRALVEGSSATQGISAWPPGVSCMVRYAGDRPAQNYVDGSAEAGWAAVAFMTVGLVAGAGALMRRSPDTSDA
jgi:hypothetical protein